MSLILKPNMGYIIMPRRFVDVEMPSNKVTAAGRYQLIVRDAWGIEKSRTPWFDNIILDSGLNRLGTAGAIAGAAIGTGTSTPLATQTGLETQSYWVSGGAPGSATAEGSSPYGNINTVTYRTALGALNGNYTEVGVGWASGSMFSRALILDGGGTPTTISISSAEQLDIVYQLRVYPPLVDTVNVVTISGVSYTVTGRAAGVNTATAGSVAPWAANAGWSWTGGSTLSNATLYDATSTLGPITGTPTGTIGGSSGQNSNAAYSNNSLTSNSTVTYPLTDGNLPGGVGGSRFWWGNVAHFQYNWSPVIPKDATKSLALNYRFSWARR